MKPRKTFGINWDDDERERMEDSMRDAFDEDDQIERERDMRLDENRYDEDDADDLVNINIG